MKMVNQFKNKEYFECLLELEKLQKEEDSLKVETKKLKENYKKSPEDDKILKDIKDLEEEYMTLYKRHAKLNNKIKKMYNASN